MKKSVSTTTSTIITAVVIDIVATAPMLIPILILLLPFSLLAYGIATLLVISRCYSAWKGLLELQKEGENRWSQFSKSALWMALPMCFYTVIFLALKSLELIDTSVALSNVVAVIGFFFMVSYFRFLGATLLAFPLTFLSFVLSPLSRDKRRCILALSVFALSLILTVLISPESVNDVFEDPILMGLSLLLGAPYGLAVGSHLATLRS